MNAKLYIVFALAMGLVATESPAQNALGDGRALDANLRVGSGGVNQGRRANTAGVYQNALVTGNVSGLASFRDTVGSRGAFEFRDSLGSDDLFDFSRRTINQSPGAFGLANPGQFTPHVPGVGQNLVFRSGAGTTTGQIGGRDRLSGLTANVYRNDVSSLQRYRGVGGAQAFQSRSMLPQTFGTAVDEQGRLLQVQSSPLTGVSMRTSPQFRPQPSTDEIRVLPPNEADTEARRVDGATNLATPILAGSDTPAGTRVASPYGVDTSQLIQPTYIAFGEQLGSHLSPTRAVRSDTAELKQFSQAVSVMVEKAKEADAEEDVYVRLLQDMAEQQAEEAAAADGAANEADPDQGADPKDDGGKALTKTLDTLDYDLPALGTLAGKGESFFNNAMAHAELMMSKGQYFSAEESYKRALRYKAGHPMARLGQAHAQLGAGLNISAAKSLRALLSDHPELIAARYKQPLLPDETRLARLTQRLAKQSEAYKRDVAAPLLLAYLAYQQKQQYAVAGHLDELYRRSPRDPLIPLLRTIWLDLKTPVKPAKDG